MQTLRKLSYVPVVIEKERSQNNGVVVGRESRQPDDGRWACGTGIRGWAPAVFGVLLSGLNHHLESVWQSRDEASVRQMHVGV